MFIDEKNVVRVAMILGCYLDAIQSGSHFQLQLFLVSILSNGCGGRSGISVTNFHANGIACSLTLNNRSRWHRKHNSLISTPNPPSNSVKAKSSVTHCSISNDLISTSTHTPPLNSVKAKSSVTHCISTQYTAFQHSTWASRVSLFLVLLL